MFQILRQIDGLLAEALSKCLDALLYLSCFLRGQFLLAHVHLSNELGDFHFFLLEDVEEMPDVGVFLVNAMGESIVPA